MSAPTSDHPSLPADPHEQPAPEVTRPRSRRALLAGLAGGAAALVANAIGRVSPTRAAAGSPLIVGQANDSGTSQTVLNNAGLGAAFTLKTTNIATGATGIFGYSNSTQTYATKGVYGRADGPNSYGVYGLNASAAGTGFGVFGIATATSGANTGVQGQSSSPVGLGVVGIATATSGANTGVHGQSSSPVGLGVVGYATATSGTNTGVYGQSDSPNGTGVTAYATATSGTNTGVYGVSDSPNGTGVVGYAAATSGTNAGVIGQSDSPGGWAGAFFGNVDISGALSATSANASIKSFRIDHPLDPANKVLMHACVESNERKLVYDGTVTTDAKGEASVALPAYFGALNTDLRYQLTPIGDARAWISAKVKGNRFGIRTDKPNTEVCWMVTGIRADAYAKAHPLVVESSKTGREKGKYLNPIEHGQPESAGVGSDLRQRAKAMATRTPKAAPMAGQ